MRIGFIEPGLHVCGGIRRIIETSNRLVNLGHDVVLYTPKGRECTWLPSKSRITTLAELPKDKLDVAIFNLAEQYKHVKLAKAKKKVFWVLAPEALYKIPDIPIKALNQNFYLIANSKFTVQYIKKHCKRKLSYKVPIIPGGINPFHFKYDKSQAKYFHAMYYGSNRPWKGTGVIETALRQMNVKSLKMEGLNTPQNQLYKLYNSANCYISAGQVEGFNFPILEAMACGCPVICTDDGGSRDFVRDGVNAIVVRRAPQDIKNALTRILNDKELQKNLRNEGLKTARNSKYDWDVVTKQFEKTLKQLLDD
jgi:glycosyltransferase involved in cell wall biosynthesis